MAPRLLLITPPTGSLDGLLAALAAVSGRPEVAVLARRFGLADRVRIEELRTLQATGVPLIVHGRADLALSVDAAGVHLPERGVAVADARALVGSRRLVGVSRHDGPGLGAAVGADYATLSPFFAVEGKAVALGPSGFASHRHAAPPGLAVLALGGIDATNAAEALEAGADGIAVLRSATTALRLLDSMGHRKG